MFSLLAAINKRAHDIGIIFVMKLKLSGKKWIEDEFTILQNFDEIIISSVIVGDISNFWAYRLQVLFPRPDMANHKFSELPVMDHFFFENVFGDVIVLIIEKVILCYL